MTNRYWNSTGTHQSAICLLQKEIPVEGPVSKGRPALEKLRRAINVYYDLYNNGLYNRARQFRGVFGFSAGVHRYKDRFGEYLYARVEEKMDEYVQAAALEAGIPLGN